MAHRFRPRRNYARCRKCHMSRHAAIGAGQPHITEPSFMDILVARMTGKKPRSRR